MNKNQMIEYVRIIQQNHYEIKWESYNSSIFKEIIKIKPKYLFSPQILITLSDAIYSKGEDFLAEIAMLNKCINDDKPLIVILIVSADTELKDTLWFNGNIFLHIVIHKENPNCIYFEKDFHYVGSKNVRELIGFIEKVII